MNILFIHGNFPGQFRSLALNFAQQSAHNVVFLTARKDHQVAAIPNVKVQVYDEIELQPQITSQFQKNIQEPVTRGLQIQKEILNLAKQGFIPRLIFFHGGNGLGLFLKELLPDSALVGYFEWYFNKSDAKNILGENIDNYNLITSRNFGIERACILHSRNNTNSMAS